MEWMIRVHWLILYSVIILSFEFSINGRKFLLRKIEEAKQEYPEESERLQEIIAAIETDTEKQGNDF